MSKPKSKSVPKYPKVKAYAPGPAILATRPDLHKSWIIPRCPWCDRLHVHGAKEGHREEHCPRGQVAQSEGWERPYGYTLKFAGTVDDPDIFGAATKREKEKQRAYYEGVEAQIRERCETMRSRPARPTEGIVQPKNA